MQMNDIKLTSEFLEEVKAVAYQAGEKILSIYHQKNIDVIDKSDGSPLTKADLLAHQTIVSGLKKLTPNIPVLSEESTEDEIRERHQWPVLWLVDPLDGTKEFIHRTDEFTVNIALIVNHQPVLGVVYAPALHVMYFAMNDYGAYKQFAEKTERIFADNWTGKNVRVVASRRHGGEELEKFLLQLSSYKLLNAGSALKICLVADGSADFYPRLGPTSEWDTAAGHAIINNAGGMLCDEQYRLFQYNKRDTLLNESFIVCHQDAPRLCFSYSGLKKDSRK